MVYNKNFVVSVKCNGKILREVEDVVYLPFGSEYSILLKNMEFRDALVDVDIDGRKAIDGLIIPKNQTVELERFFENNKNNGHKFKFIEKTEEISNFRGDKIEDGVVRVSYRFEKQKEIVHHVQHIYHEHRNYWPEPQRTWITWSDNSIPCSETVNTYSSNSSSNVVLDSLQDNNLTRNSCDFKNQDGITVEGNQSNQQFQYGSIGELEETINVICLKLKGGNSALGKIKQPITVQTKIQCRYCGRHYKSSQKFCGNCGASLGL